MGVAKKLKQPSKQQNPAKPKKETVAKTVKKQRDAAKPTEATTKKSSRIQNQKNKKLKVKSPQKLAQNKKLEGRLPAQSANNVQKDTTAKQSVRKTKTEKTTLPPNAKKTSNSKTGNNKKQPKALPKTAEVAKDAKASAKQTTKVVKKTKVNEASKSVVEKQSVSTKLQKKKRKSRTSPLKKTLNGKIVKGKKGSLGKKESLSGKAKKKKPRKSQLNLAIEQNRGVVYFSHLPHGMYENELKEYCTQFGRVTGVYVPRSVNGNARGYAFVEFQHPEVAEVVADTMNNYLMHTRLVKAELVPLERQKPWIFRNGKDGMKVAKKRKSDALAARTRKLTPDQEESLQKKQLARVNRLKKKLSEKGRDYEFTVVS